MRYKDFSTDTVADHGEALNQSAALFVMVRRAFVLEWDSTYSKVVQIACDNAIKKG